MWKLILLTLLITANFSLGQEKVYCKIQRKGKCVFTSIEIEEDETVIFGIKNSNNTSDIWEISFKESSIFEVPKELFPVFPNLLQLDLIGQKVRKLATETFNNATQLDGLWLTKNYIFELPTDAFNGLSNLTELFLQENEIEILNYDCFKGLSKLKDLTLDNNNLDFLPANVFKELVNLQTIHLFKNKLEFLPKRLFETNKKLTLIYLYDNPIKAAIPSMFSHLSELDILDIAGSNCINRSFMRINNYFKEIEGSMKKCSISEFFLNKYDDIKLEIQNRIKKFVYKLEKIMELSRIN